MSDATNLTTNARAMPMGSLSMLRDIGTDTVGCLTRLQQQYGSVVGYAKGNERAVFAFGPEANHDIFTDVETFRVYGPPGPRDSSQRRFLNGMFGLNGAKHLEHRRMLMPAMRREVVVAQGEAMTRLTDDYLDRLRPGENIDLYAAMKEFSLAIAGKILFGLDEIPRSQELAETFQLWLDGYIGAMFEMALPVRFPFDNYNRMVTMATRLEEHFRELIDLWKPPTVESGGNMLGMLLAARDAGRIADADIIGEMQTLLNASYQTTGSALTWIFLMLAQHPDVMRRLYEEFESAAPDAVRDSVYLDCVIKESLRILPPVVFAIRCMTRAGTLAGHSLPEGTIVYPSIYVTHHMAATFPEPERFLPERWIGKSVSPYAYLPFGAGSRMCMGTAFSLQLFKIVVPEFVKRFRFELRPGTRVDRHSTLTLGVDGSLPVTVLKQDGCFQAAALTGNIHEMVDMPRSMPMRRAA